MGNSNSGHCAVPGCLCSKSTPPISFRQSCDRDIYTVKYKEHGVSDSHALLTKLVLLTNKYPDLEADIDDMLNHAYFRHALRKRFFQRTIFHEPISVIPILINAAKYSRNLSSENTIKILLKHGADPYLKDWKFDQPGQVEKNAIEHAKENINTTSTPETVNILNEQ